MSLEKISLDGEKIKHKGREIQAVPIGEPVIIDFDSDKDPILKIRIEESAPEGANAFSRRNYGVGSTPVQYYRIVK